ncbi:MAG: Cytochrome c-type biogenesis protein CcmG/DsbE, thiol:disulfide oxidoreductase [uncultured Caballeronia sp.]|nr:MAG: Cytochrome c-type biogenesis protein CcmG/DsbE, thiol:disulfide oxidoreductase [uncultured Caballeronia sp.]
MKSLATPGSIPGQSIEVGGYSFRFDGTKEISGPNYRALRANVIVSREGRVVALMHPEKRFFPVQKTTMTEVAVNRGLFRDLYVALGDAAENSNTAWTVRVQIKPFVDWIWAGCLLMAFGGVLAASLSNDPRRLPSTFIGKQAPAFDLPRLDVADRRLSPEALRGQVWVMNVWASWCESFRDEHAALVALARRNIVAIYGLGYKDDPDAAQQWLKQVGDPYIATMVDPSGQTGIDYGVYGVPETFIVDRRGVIRFKRSEPLTQAVLDTQILPLVRTLQGEGSDE